MNYIYFFYETTIIFMGFYIYLNNINNNKNLIKMKEQENEIKLLKSKYNLSYKINVSSNIENELTNKCLKERLKTTDKILKNIKKKLEEKKHLYRK